jgi:hypothetical protein
MTPFQIIALVAAVALGMSIVRRFMLRRSITHYDAASVQSRLKERPAITLLDVRTAGERSRGLIRGSVHILQSRRAVELEIPGYGDRLLLRRVIGLWLLSAEAQGTGRSLGRHWALGDRARNTGGRFWRRSLAESQASYYYYVDASRTCPITEPDRHPYKVCWMAGGPSINTMKDAS